MVFLNLLDSYHSWSTPVPSEMSVVQMPAGASVAMQGIDDECHIWAAKITYTVFSGQRNTIFAPNGTLAFANRTIRFPNAPRYLPVRTIISSAPARLSRSRASRSMPEEER